MNILRVSSSLSPEKPGGIGVHVHELSRVQGNNGHNVIVLTSDNGDHTLPRKENRDGYKVIRHSEIMRPADNSITPKVFRTLVENIDDFDVIHAHSYLFFNTNLSAVVSKVYDVPLVITHHGMFPSSAPKLLEKLYIPTIGKLTFNSSDLILCYTESARHQIKQQNISTSVQVVHNGVDCSHFNPVSASNGDTQILFVGRLKKGKGVRLLLEAFENIEQKNLSLKIVGDGPLHLELKNNYCHRNITFAGKVPYHKIPRVYQESDLLVLPTRTEAALPRVVMEAWACEIPIAITDIPQINNDIVEQAGYTISDRTVEELTRVLSDAIQDRGNWEGKGVRGREIVEENYSWKETVTKTSENIEEVINNVR